MSTHTSRSDSQSRHGSSGREYHDKSSRYSDRHHSSRSHTNRDDRNDSRSTNRHDRRSEKDEPSKKAEPENPPIHPPPKKVPISLEELLAKKEQERKATERPKFLTKEQRAQLALEKRQKEVDEIRKRQEEERKAREAFDSKAEEEHQKQRELARNRHSGRYDYDQRRSDRYGSSRYSRDNGRTREREREKEKERGDGEKNDLLLNEKEEQAIRDRYIGGERKKRKIRRMNEKKFVFDWDAGEDTSLDTNPLYENRHSAQMFGRGHIAGVDANDETQKSSFYNRLLNDRRSAQETERAEELASLGRKKEAKRKWDERHWTDKPLEEMQDRDWRIFKEDYNIATKGGRIPHPLRSWEEAGLPEKILNVIKKVGYKEPTPIQRQAIPIGIQNRDLIGVAETGSGKTASFVIPMLVHIMGLPKRVLGDIENAGPYALILAPTRELALQIEVETVKFAEPLGLACVAVVGGRDEFEQQGQLQKGVDVVIATTGRLRAFVEQHIVVLNQCKYVVMDEADRMIDMNFEEDVNMILDTLPEGTIKPDNEEAEALSSVDIREFRQTTMFSATMPSGVERLAKKYLRRPAVVTIGNAGQAVRTVEQRVELISDEFRNKRLTQILNSGEFESPIIIFVNEKRTIDAVEKMIKNMGYSTAVLHGGKSQDQREYALSRLKTGEADILVATDVAGRGIDVKDVSLVINFDMAKSIEDYTHRIGRTGRAGQSGVAITFLQERDSEIFYNLKKMLESSPLSKVPPELAKHEAAQVRKTQSRQFPQETAE